METWLYNFISRNFHQSGFTKIKHSIRQRCNNVITLINLSSQKILILDDLINKALRFLIDEMI